MKKTVLALMVMTMVLLVPTLGLASEYTVRPFLIDEVMEPRQQVTKPVLLSNNSTNRRYIVYATVNEITVDTAGEVKEFIPSTKADRTVTITSWIEVTRGRISIPPGENREVPLTVKVNPQAQPGEYHAFVGFVPATNRPEAEAMAMAGDVPGVILKITVSDQRKEGMRLSSFGVSRFVFGGEDRNVEIEIENTGDFSSAPTGEVILYNSRGEEVASLPINQEGNVVDPGQTEKISLALPETGLFGKLKANLVLEYGEKQRASIFDTAFFYVIPWYFVAIMAVIALLLSVIITVLFRRSFLAQTFNEDAEEVPVFIKDGHDAKPQDHDINLKSNN